MNTDFVFLAGAVFVLLQNYSGLARAEEKPAPPTGDSKTAVTVNSGYSGSDVRFKLDPAQRSIDRQAKIP